MDNNDELGTKTMSYRFGPIHPSMGELAQAFETSPFTTLERLMNFTLYVPRQSLTNFMVKYDLFLRILPVHGSIIECGVCFGGGIQTWAHLSSILEPTNYTRRIIGFDTFSGFPSVSDHDTAKAGGLAVDSQAEIETCMALHDKNRFIGHIPKIELVKGDASVTIPAWKQRNQHILVSLLNLDFDLYAPTRTALDTFLPRMPKGSLVVFDELNMKEWPGETQAFCELMDVNDIKLERCAYGTTISWFQV